MPPGVTISTLTLPKLCTGVVQVICVIESTLQAPDTPPKVTFPLYRFVPEMITGESPVVGPISSESPVMAGADGAETSRLTFLVAPS